MTNRIQAVRLWVQNMDNLVKCLELLQVNYTKTFTNDGMTSLEIRLNQENAAQKRVISFRQLSQTDVEARTKLRDFILQSDLQSVLPDHAHNGSRQKILLWFLSRYSSFISFTISIKLKETETLANIQTQLEALPLSASDFRVQTKFKDNDNDNDNDDEDDMLILDMGGDDIGEGQRLGGLRLYVIEQKILSD